MSVRIKNPSPTYSLTAVNLVLGFDYETSGVIDMKMDSLAVVQINTPIADINPILSVKSIGTLNLRQLNPILETRGITR